MIGKQTKGRGFRKLLDYLTSCTCLVEAGGDALPTLRNYEGFGLGFSSVR